MKIHPLSGEMLTKPVNGHPRKQIAELYFPVTQNRRAEMTYDGARSGTDLDNHWQFADNRDSDRSNSAQVRHTLIKRSRYEDGSNGYYAGIIRTHCNMLIGGGPNLRMLSGTRTFNQLVEKEFAAWCKKIQLRRKLWCMAHARTCDGEAFGVFVNNPAIQGDVQLDVLLIEAEQCQTPFIPPLMLGYIDGIRFDEFGNILWYDILPQHPGSGLATVYLQPIQVAPNNVVHWWKMERPGGHRSPPDLKSTLNCGASARRSREATVAAQETAADIAAMLTTQSNASSSDEPDPVAPFSSVEFAKRMMMIAPMGWDAKQMKGEHPNAQYAEFQRSLIAEQASPIGQPVNLAMKDSSTYSFASGKLDTLGYFAAIDVERDDCDDCVMDKVFAAWFREWTILEGRKDIPPDHQWDWPAKPIIDEVAHATATDSSLKNGSATFRQIFSDRGLDLEDQLVVMAEDTFGEATDDTVDKCRKILRLINTPKDSLPYVANLMGVELPAVITKGASQDETIASDSASKQGT